MNNSKYITRFTGTDRQKEDLCYETLDEAKEALLKFVGVTTEKYRNIAVLEQTGAGRTQTLTVKMILPFANGKPQPIISDGDIVRLKPEFAHPCELKYLFRVSNIHEEYERLNIICINSGGAIAPSQAVGLETVCPIKTERTEEEKQ